VFAAAFDTLLLAVVVVGGADDDVGTTDVMNPELLAEVATEADGEADVTGTVLDEEVIVGMSVMGPPTVVVDWMVAGGALATVDGMGRVAVREATGDAKEPRMPVKLRV
jgi:hypothetical protein